MENNVKKKCPKCLRVYNSSVMTCRVCQCLVLTDQEYEEYLSANKHDESVLLLKEAEKLYKIKRGIALGIIGVSFFVFVVLVTLAKYWIALLEIALALVASLWIIYTAKHQLLQSNVIAEILSSQKKIIAQMNYVHEDE